MTPPDTITALVDALRLVDDYLDDVPTPTDHEGRRALAEVQNVVTLALAAHAAVTRYAPCYRHCDTCNDFVVGALCQGCGRTPPLQ